MNIDKWRLHYLAWAEFIDAWRLIPRAIVLLFGYGVYHVTKWYMNLAPHLVEGCVKAGGTISECLVLAPTTQHTALLTALFALAAAVFAFYSNNGRKWDHFTFWNKNSVDESDPKN